MALEALEPRTLMAVLPPAAVSTQIDISGSQGDESSPSIAIDPTDPLKLAAVWTRHDPTLQGQTKVIVEGAASVDGGRTWSQFATPGVDTDPTSVTANPQSFAQVTDASVAFDRNDNFYILESQHSATGAAGELLVQKFSLQNSITQAQTLVPNAVPGKKTIVYAWTQDQAVKPILAVDANLPSFTDADPNGNTRTQIDNFAGNVYVAWATNDTPPPGAVNFNPNTIKIAVSSDGGQTFSGASTLNDGGSSGIQRNTAPRLAISQGRPAGTNGPNDLGVPGGQVTLAWDDFGSSANANPPEDLIKSEAIQGGASVSFSATPGPIADAGANNAPSTTDFLINVPTITDPEFTAVSNLDVRLAINHPNVAELQIQLVSPSGKTVTLVPTAGASGTSIGIGTGGALLGATFDANANLAITPNGGGAAPYIGRYRPASGSLSQFIGSDPKGIWHIQITDSTTNNAGTLQAATLVFTSALTGGPAHVAAATTVRGALVGPYPTASAATPLGIGPAPTIASDNTLGQFSDHQGRLYVTYVDRYNPAFFPGATNNPADNTDIFLVSSDDGGVTWGPATQVNDDSAARDGFSEGVGPNDPAFKTAISGRPQFAPQVAVDNATGTVVVSYYDARYDAARARVAMSLGASIDGGQTFNPQVFANTPMAPFDGIARTTVNLGPIPDNQSPGNPNTDALFGFGDRQGLAVLDGHVYPAWSSNFNGGSDGRSRLDIRVAPTTIATGPGVVSSTMGPVRGGMAVDLNNANLAYSFNNQSAADGTPIPDGFLVTFDRPINFDPTFTDPTAFGPADVQVFYRDPNTAGTAPGVAIPVTAVIPVRDTDPSSSVTVAQQQRWGPTKFLVRFAVPANATSRTGTYSYAIGPNVRDRIRAAVSSDIFYPPAGQVGQPIPDNNALNSTLTVATPADQVVGVTVSVTLTHPLDSSLVLSLHGPNGVTVTLANKRGGATGQNFVATTFDDGASTPIAFGQAPFTGSFRPEAPLASFDGIDPNGNWTLIVQDTQGDTLTGMLADWHLNLITRNSSLMQASAAVQSGAPMDQAGDGQGGQDPTKSTFFLSAPGDIYAVPTPNPAAPALFGPQTHAPFGPVFDQATQPLIVPGPHVVSTHIPGTPTTTDNLVTDRTVGAVDVTFDRDIQTGTFGPADVLRLSTPVQDIANQAGQPSPFTVTPAFNSADVNKAIPNGGTITSALIIPDDAGRFTISNLRVRLDITHAHDADLTAVLIAPDGTQITLFQGVGGASGKNFTDTVLDDQAATDIANGIAPFNGSYHLSGGATLASLAGKELRGTWTLELTDAASGNVGVLNAWSLEATPQAIAAPAPFTYAGPAVPIPAGGTLDNTITVPADGGKLLVGELTVGLDVSQLHTANLTAILIGPDGTRVTLFSGVGGASGKDFTGTVLTDSATIDIAAGASPFTGTFRPAQALAAFNGKAAQGSWTLELVNSDGTNAGALKDWSLAVTPTSALARTFRIGIPTQQLSGQYTVTLGPDVQARNGDKVDANLNAGLDAIRGTFTGNSATIVYPSSDPTPPVVGGGMTTTSTINVHDSFSVQGVTVLVNIAYPNDPDLTATLIAPDGTSVPLFANVGASGSQTNFTNTIFDDTATTPIQNGGPPFFGRFNPLQPLGNFKGHGSLGVWTLQIVSSKAGSSGQLFNWSLSLRKPITATGLGEPVADRTTAGFRVFTFDPTIPLSGNTWTPVGPASTDPKAPALNGETVGRVSSLAVDPSDPSGNTVYVGAASGGIWKTTDFLTTDPNGPTYVPLTDFGPALGINIGSIAVFGRNNDPNQSIIFAATGDADALGDPGVEAPRTARGLGFLRSLDGGSTWQLLDSTDNSLPFATPDGIGQRDHIFAVNGGTVVYKVAVDPRALTTGDVIVYAAVTGVGNSTAGGVWRSIDTGKTWQLMRAGQATDLVLDLNSGTGVADNSTGVPVGNLQNLEAAFEGDGVYFSPNRGQNWNLMAGGIGDPLIQNAGPTPQPVPVNGGATPNGAKGRIVLARPALTDDPLKNQLYQGWLYAAVATPGGVYPAGSHLDGVYLTKDFGQNWTRVDLPNVPGTGTTPTNPVVPTNNTTDANYTILGSQTPAGTDFGTGNFNLALAIDPNDPNVIYLGGTSEFQASGLARIDTTGIADPHAHYLSNSQPDGGLRQAYAQGPVALSQPNLGLLPVPYLQAIQDGPFGSTINLIANPAAPFQTGSTILVTNTARFANNGAGTKWTPFDQALKPDPFNFTPGDPFAKPTRGLHKIVTVVDPKTGLSRLLFADDNGVYTAVDNGDGALVGSLGDTGTLATRAGDVAVASGTRNGNLQIAQMYSGASQPSYVAGQVATLQGMFYGTTRDNGTPQSDPNIVNPGQPGYGDIAYGQPSRGSGGGVATQQNFVVDPTTGRPTATGTVYQYLWPETLNNNGQPTSDFFQVNGVSRTFGLLLNAGGGDVADPSQWPYRQGFRFAVNPINGDQILISSAAGRVFRTENQGRFWSVIGDPGALDGTQAPALAFGAPDPNGPGGIGNLDNYLLAGTQGGHIFVTQTGGGGAGNQWTNISTGLDGSPVLSIATNPQRGSHEAYAITSGGATGSFANIPPPPPVNGVSENTISQAHPVGMERVVVNRDIFASHLSVTVNIAYPNDGALTLTLIAPDGTPFTLSSNAGGNNANFTGTVFDDDAQAPITSGNAPFTGQFQPAKYLSDRYHLTADFYGKNLKGTWTLVADNGGDANNGTLTDWSLSFTSLGGIFHNTDTTSGQPWQQVTSDLFRTQIPVFGDPSIVDTTLRGLTSLAVDWRYTIPNDFKNPNAGVHPMLYVGGQAGVYRSANGGNSWLPFPSADPNDLNATPNPPGAGGGLPDVPVTDLNLALGNVDPNSGRPRARIVVDPNDPSKDLVSPNLLLATTYGRGQFAVRLAPSVFGGSLALDPVNPTTAALGGSDSGNSSPGNNPAGRTPDDQHDLVTNVAHPVFDGYSEQSAFGNVVYVSLYNLDDPRNPIYVGGYNPNDSSTFGAQNQTDGTGKFTVTLTGALADGKHTIGVQATDQAGTKGNMAEFQFTLDTTPPAKPNPPVLEPGSDTGPSNTDDITSSTSPIFDVSVIENLAKVVLFRDGKAVNTLYDVVPTSGVLAIQDPGPVADGVHVYTVQQFDVATNAGPVSDSTSITVITATPAAPSIFRLESGDDTGISNTDDFTRTNKNLHFDAAIIQPFAELDLLRNGVVVATIPNVGPVGGTVTIVDPGKLADGTTPLPDGVYVYTARQVDLAGNLGALSAPVTVTILTVPPPAPAVPHLQAADDTGISNNDGITTKDTNLHFDIAGIQTGNLNGTVELLRNGIVVATTQYVTTATVTLIDPGPVPDGTYSYTARQTDKAGNVSAVSGPETITIETGNPAIPGAPTLLPADDSGASAFDDYTNVTNPRFTVAPAISTATVRLLRKLASDPATAYVVVGTRVGPGLIQDPGPVQPDGVYTYAADEVTLAGNTSPRSPEVQVTIDTTPPVAPSVPVLDPNSDSGIKGDNITNDISPSLDVNTAEATATVELLRNGVVVGTRVGPGPIADPGPVQPDGSYIYTAMQIDLAGNVGPVGGALKVTILTVPPAAPGVPVLEASSDSGLPNNPDITNITNPIFDVNPAVATATVQLLRKLATAPASTYVVVGTRVGAGAIQDPGPVADGVYDYAARQIDVAGNPGPRSGSVQVTIDTTPPAAPNPPDLDPGSDTGESNSDKITSAVLLATVGGFPLFNITPVEPGATVRLFRNGSLINTGVVANNGQLTITLSDPGPAFPDGVFQYTTQQVDRAGNVGPVSAAEAVTYINAAPPPPAAPILDPASDSGLPNNPDVTNVTNPVFDVAGTGHLDTLELLRDGVVVATLHDIAGGITMIQDPGPVPDGVHSYTAFQKDIAGNIGPMGGSLRVTILTVPPGPPGAPVLDPASDSGVKGDNITDIINPTIDVNQALPAVTVQLLRDGVVVGSRTGPGGIQDPGPVAAGIHTYTARQIDAAGNVGVAGPPLVVTIDVTAGAPNAPVLDPASDSGVLGDNLTNVANPLFDLVGIKPGATVTLFRDGKQVGSRVGTGTVQDPGPVADGVHLYTAQQTDVAGNVSPLSGATSVTILTVSPAAPAAPVLVPADDTGTPSDNITGKTTLHFTVAGVIPVGTIQLLRNGVVVQTQPTGGATTVTITDAGPLGSGVYTYTARQIDAAGNTSPVSAALQVTVIATAPPAPAKLVLDPASDSGVKGDNITSVTNPTFDLGQIQPGAKIELFRDGALVTDSKGNPVTAALNDTIITDPGRVTDGSHVYTALQIDVAGNVSPFSDPLTITIDSSIPAALGAPALSSADNTGYGHSYPVLTTGFTSKTSLDFIVTPANTADPIQLLRKPKGADPTSFAVVATVAGGRTDNAPFTISDPGPLANGGYDYALRQSNPAGGLGIIGPITTVTVDTTVPAAVTPTLANYTGLPGANVTVSRRPQLTGTTKPLAIVQLLDSTGVPIAAALADANGNFNVAPNADLFNGHYTFSVRVIDPAGNLGPAGPAVNVAVTTVAGDYDGSGRANLATYEPSTGVWSILPSTGGAARTIPFGAPNVDVPVPADYDGTGKTEVAVYRPTTGQWIILPSSGGVRVVTFGAPGIDIPVPGDYDGDGKTDIGVYRPTTGQWIILPSSGGVRVVTFGAPGIDKPVPADYDGDGKTDIGVYRPTTGQWLIVQSTAGLRVQPFGSPGDVPVPRDYDGDGRADLTVFRPSTAQYLGLMSAGGLLAQQVGSPGDIPVAADYGGDGRADLAVYRPSTGLWVIGQASGPRLQVFGTPNLDVPLPAPYDYRVPRGTVHTTSVAGTGTSLDFAGQAASLAVAPTPGVVAKSHRDHITRRRVVSRRPVHIVHHAAGQGGHTPIVQQQDTALATALGGLGRIKGGRFLGPND